MCRKFKLDYGDNIGITACSDALLYQEKQNVDLLVQVLRSCGLVPVLSPCIFGSDSFENGNARQKAAALMQFYCDERIKAVFDISGGDSANEILDYLDYSIISKSGKPFWGYSDLTTVITALGTKAYQCSYLYQIKNLVFKDGKNQLQRFTESVLGSEMELYMAHWKFLQGQEIQGVTTGGNIRCLLKLAGTPYWPDMDGKVLFLESFGGSEVQVNAYLYQLKQIGVFNRISGLLLGTFTKIQQAGKKNGIEDLVLRVIDDFELPVAKTEDIGHGTNARCLVIGEKIHLCVSCRAQ